MRQYILESPFSCIDLIFTSQPNSHYQIIFAKFNQEIQYQPPYFCDIWHFEDANTDLIRQAIDMFDWDGAFINTDVNEKVIILNKTILNILSNFI